MSQAFRCTQEVVDRIRALKAESPSRSQRAIAAMFTPPLSHYTVGRVLSGQKQATIDENGRPTKPRFGGRIGPYRRRPGK